VVEGEIIPRLLVAHRTEGKSADATIPIVSDEEVGILVEILLRDNVPAIGACVEGWRARGVTLETILLGPLPHAARLLGELWGDDTCNFSEVTLGMWRLHQLLHDLSPVFQSEGGIAPNQGLRVLLSPVAAEQHTFGMLLVSEFFRRAGWEVCSELPAANEQLVDMVRTEWFDAIGLSVSGDVTFGELSRVIASLRQASRNINVTIMVGGAIFIQKPELVAVVGADFSASSPIEAVEKSCIHVRRKNVTANCGSPSK
jgi:methanogenic corrinoid protein MtbC1